MANDQTTANITANSDSYDYVMQKIIYMNQKLNAEISKSKDALESTNDIYAQLSSQADDFVQAIGRVVGASTQGNGQITDSLRQVQNRVSDLAGNTRSGGIKAIAENVKSLTGLLRGGGGNFSGILTSALRTTASQAQNLSSSMASTSSSIAATAPASGAASAGIAGVGSTAIAATAVITGLAVAIAALIAGMYKLGEGGYEYELTIANAENTLGTGFQKAYDWAVKLNNELGVSEAKTLSLISSTAQIGTDSGMSTESSTNMGIGANRLATNISNNTGIDTSTIQEQINQAISTGSNTLGSYGINVGDTAAKKWLQLKTGIDAFSGTVSESTMEYARFMLIQEQASLLKYKDTEGTENLAMMQLKLKNTWESVAQYAQVLFIPVLEVVGKALVAIGEFSLFAVNGIRQLLGMDTLSLSSDIGPTEESIDAANALYSSYKKSGDELEALKQQLYGFDEVQSISPYDSTIADISTADAGIDDIIDEDGSVAGSEAGSSFALSFKDVVKGILGKMGTLGDFIGDIFNIDDKDWEEMTELEQWLSNPTKKLIELIQGGDADFGDLLRTLIVEGLKSLPIIGEISALLSGDGAEFIKKLIQDGFTLNPLTWPLGLLWKGFDILLDFKDENGSWDTILNFLGIDKLTEVADTFYSWIQKAIDLINTVNPITVGTNVGSSIGSWISEKFSGLTTSGSVPQYANGGFMKAQHLAIMDPNEVALPLNSSSAQPAYASIASSLSEYLGSPQQGSAQTINVTIKTDALIASDYAADKLAKQIGQRIVNYTGKTGSLSYGSK